MATLDNNPQRTTYVNQSAQPNDTADPELVQELQSQVDELVNSIQFAEQSLRRLQSFGTNGNATVLGGTSGAPTTTAPPLTKSGVTVPFVSNVRVVVSSSNATSSTLFVAWNNADDPLGII